MQASEPMKGMVGYGRLQPRVLHHVCEMASAWQKPAMDRATQMFVTCDGEICIYLCR
jgi:hypothetical protein